jgi:hypothetical protein
MANSIAGENYRESGSSLQPESGMVAGEPESALKRVIRLFLTRFPQVLSCALTFIYDKNPKY